MEYQDFEKFYRTDPVTFHLGMELLEGRGRDALSASTDQALCSAVTKKLSELLTADKILAVIKAARDFAGLSAVERLSYAGGRPRGRTGGLSSLRRIPALRGV